MCNFLLQIEYSLMLTALRPETWLKLILAYFLFGEVLFSEKKNFILTIYKCRDSLYNSFWL